MMSVRNGGAPKTEQPKRSKREEAIESGALMAQTDDEGNVTGEQWDRYNPDGGREMRGEVALEAALERGREMKQGLMDKVAPYLQSLRTRISNLAQRGWKALSSLVGYGAEKKDAAIEGAQYAGKVLRNAPAGMAGMAKFAYDDLAKPVAEAMHDIVRPQDELPAEIRAQITELEIRMSRIEAALPSTRAVEARNALADEHEKLRLQKEELENTPRERNLRGKKATINAAKTAGKVAAYGAAGTVAGAAALAASPVLVPAAAAGYGMYKVAEKTAAVTGAAYDRAEAHIKEREPRYIRIGIIVEDALSKILGKRIMLTDKQAIAIGLAFEGSGIAANFMKDGVETAQDLVNKAQEGVNAVREVYQLLADPETRAMIVDIFKQIGIDIAEEVEEAARRVGARVVKGAKTAGKWTGGAAAAGAAGYAAGTVGLAAAPMVASAAIAAAPVVGAGLAVGAAGAGAYMGWKKVQPSVMRAIDGAIDLGRRTWKKAEPRVIDGIASTVAPMIMFSANVLDAPEDARREYRAQREKLKAAVEGAVVQLNAFAAEAAVAANDAAERVGKVMAVAEHARNEMLLALAEEKAAGKDKALVEDLRAAAEALDALDAEASREVAPALSGDAADAPDARIASARA